MSNKDIWHPVPRVETVPVRVERTMSFVARKYLDLGEALGGQTMEQAGLDPDLPIADAATAMIRAWAKSPDRVMGYLAQWGFIEREVCDLHKVTIRINGTVVHEEDVV